MFFQIIGSSSEGNCALLRENGKNFLIDAGVGIRKIEKYLSSQSLDISDICGIFITHEHSDHCKALPSFVGLDGLKVFSNKITRDCIIGRFNKTADLHWNIFEDGMPFEFCGMNITPFSIPHDAADTVGYSFKIGSHDLVWLTDLGKLTTLAFSRLQEADILVLESNYCPVMLSKSKRTFYLKQRISGTHGHLSNSDAIDALNRLSERFPSKVFLAHISRECNSVDHILELLSKSLPSDFISRIEVVAPASSSSPITIL